MQPSTLSRKEILIDCLLWIFLVLPCSHADCGTSEYFRRQNGTSCVLPAAIPEASWGRLEAGTAVKCAQFCARECWCLAYVFWPVGRECHLLNDLAQLTGSCGSGAGVWQTWVRDSAMQSAPSTTVGPLCQNGGTEQAAGGCQCFFGYVGDYCERLAEDCKDIQDSGHYQFHTFALLTIRPALSPHNMTVLCRANGHTVFLRQDDSHAEGLNVTWGQYVEGFTLVPEGQAYWMGLRNLYYLSNSKAYKLALYIRLQNSTLLRIWYKAFTLANDVDFTAQLGSFKSGPAGLDLLDDIHGNPFSTYDHSHGNNDYASCALAMGGGWWFGSTCATAVYNLVGKVSEGAEGSGYFVYGSVPATGIKTFTVSLAN